MECAFCSVRRWQPAARPLHGRTQSRAESSLRRTRTALRVQPHPSFKPSIDTTHDHIIFNPPSSAPNEYHTPLKFLPKSDPRRQVYNLSASSSASQSITTPQITNTLSSSIIPTRHLPPALIKPYEKKYHLTPRDVDEIRRLRNEDARKWTVARLAEKFECSQFFIQICSKAPPEVLQALDKEAEAVRDRWGRQKREAREDRRTRKDLWGRAV